MSGARSIAVASCARFPPGIASDRPIPLDNANYFEDAHGAPLILCGSHSWNTLQDWGTDGLVRPLDFDAFVRFLEAHGHNFTLLWCVELPKFRGLPTTEVAPPDFTVSPFPWPRTGPGHATDGGLKFDLTRFDQAYFDRLRSNLQGFEIGNTLLREFPVLLDKVVFDPAHRRRGEGLPPIDGALTNRNLRVSPPAPPR